jgi:hypothetical protein
VRAKTTPHITFDIEKGISMGPGVAITVRMQNCVARVPFLKTQNCERSAGAPPNDREMSLAANNHISAGKEPEYALTPVAISITTFCKKVESANSRTSPRFKK